MQLIRRISRVADGAARFLVVGALFAASVAALLRAPNARRAEVRTARSQITVAPVSATARASKLSLAAAYGNLPLSFEANRGQVDPRVRFLARGPGSELFLAYTEAVLVLTNALSSDSEAPQEAPIFSSIQLKAPNHPTRTQSTALRFSILGANPGAEISGVDPLPGATSYFIGKDPAKWRTAIPNFSRVAYRDIYPGVDLAYYGSGRNLEFDFDIAPHADPSQVCLQIDGANSIETSAEGDLVIATTAGEVRLKRPEIYQVAKNRREAVDGSYILEANNEISLKLGAYDSNRALILDPVIQYSTFLGGTTSDAARGIFVDTAGNAYITGNTSSIDFPTTSGILQANLRGTQNAFVSKLNATGAVLLYSTYLGGTGATGDAGYGIAVDSQGDAYVTGSTSSSDFPTVNPFQSSLKGTATNAFVAEVNPTATALLYSTFLGGTGGAGDAGLGIAVDSSGSAYVAGRTSSGDFPLQGAVQTSLKNAVGAGFVTKLGAGGSSLVYSTYLGGSGSLGDAASAITLDSSSDAFVAGQTSSSDFPATTGAFQTVLHGTGTNAFLTEVNPGGSAFSYSTFLGGSSTNGGAAQAVALDSSGAAYLTGGTTASDFPVTSSAVQKTATGTDTHAFVSKLNPAGTGAADLVYSTYLSGSNGNDFGTGIAVDSSGSANITGSAASTDFPATPGAIQSTPNSAGGNAFITRLNPSGSVFLYSSSFGGSNAKGDLGNGIALDSSGSAYVAGATFSPDFPTTQGSLLPNFRASSGNSNGFVAKLEANAVINVFPSSIGFGSVLLNVPSQPQLVTVTNNSTAALNFSAPPTLSGKNVLEYASATTCGVSLAPNASCNVTVSFLPKIEGLATASLTFTDDDPSSPQVVPITGTGGLDFTLTGPGTESVSRGSNVTFTVTVTPVDNSTQTVNLTCTGVPMDATCTLSPASIPLDGVDAVASTVTVTAASFVPPASRPRRGPGDFIGRWPLVVLSLALLAAFAFTRRRALRLGFAAATLACLLFAGCGSGGGTPSGMFTLVITGTPTDGGMVHTVNVTLNVN